MPSSIQEFNAKQPNWKSRCVMAIYCNWIQLGAQWDWKHTLAQNSHCEFWCGMYHTCKNTPIKHGRNWLMTRGEKQCEGILSMSLLDATYPSEPSRYLSWKIATTVQWKKRKSRNQLFDMPVLGLAGRHQEIQSRHLKAGTQSWSDSASSTSG